MDLDKGDPNRLDPVWGMGTVTMATMVVDQKVALAVDLEVMTGMGVQWLW